jgi:hypothetical protein
VPSQHSAESRYLVDQFYDHWTTNAALTEPYKNRGIKPKLVAGVGQEFGVAPLGQNPHFCSKKMSSRDITRGRH